MSSFVLCRQMQDTDNLVLKMCLNYIVSPVMSLVRQTCLDLFLPHLPHVRQKNGLHLHPSLWKAQESFHWFPLRKLRQIVVKIDISTAERAVCMCSLFHRGWLPQQQSRCEKNSEEELGCFITSLVNMMKLQLFQNTLHTSMFVSRTVKYALQLTCSTTQLSFVRMNLSTDISRACLIYHTNCSIKSLLAFVLCFWFTLSLPPCAAIRKYPSATAQLGTTIQGKQTGGSWC